MSQGKLRSHERCRKNKRYDPEAPICKVCGYRAFFPEHGQRKLFERVKP